MTEDDKNLESPDVEASEESLASEETTDSPEPEFVESEKYKKTLKESMKRKQQIRELREQLDAYESKTQQADEATQSVEKYKRLLAEKEKTISELTYKGRVRDAIGKLNPVSEKVAELVFQDAYAADVLDNAEEFEDFLTHWKKDNAAFFKAEATIATTPQPKAQVETTKDTASEIEEFKAMSREERQRLPKSKFDRLMKQIGN